MRKLFRSLSLLFVLAPLFSLPSAFADPGCGSTVIVSTTLASNIGPCSDVGLSMGADSIVLDCAGHTISGSGVNDGISLVGRTGVTVKNCIVTGFGFGFYLASSSSNTLSGNSANGNQGGCGFCFQNGSPTTNNIVTGNIANLNVGQGFNVNSASFTDFTGNTANRNSQDGFLLSGSSSNTLTSNTADGNSYDGYFDSGSNTYSSNECSGNGFGGSAPPGLCGPQQGGVGVGFVWVGGMGGPRVLVAAS